MRVWRVAVAAAVLIVLAWIGVRLLPLCLRNLELERFLEQTAASPASLATPDERLRVAVVDKAARLGLPVKTGQVRLKRFDTGLRIEVRYTVPVELPLYTVDLHFSPQAGGR